MGLSASQARLLSLTARQSNLEYEGQQINQQRTTLSNESSNYYNSLLEMSVPVPPSTNDYTKVVYTFTIGGNEATVKEALPIDDPKTGDRSYVISYTTKLSVIGIQENEAYKTAASAKNTKGVINEAAKNSDGSYSNYNDDDVEHGTLYYLATMNRVGNIEEAKAMKQAISDLDIFVQADDFSNNCLVIGPDGYEITNYNSLTDEDKKKCKFYVKDNEHKADPLKTRYALSYAEIPNQTTYDAHKGSSVITDKAGNSTSFYTQQDKIYTIREANSTDTDAKNGLYSYKASNQSKFTVVEPQYEESFINAGLNINDYYQYQATSGVRFVKRNDVEGNLNTESITIGTSAVSTISVVKENTMTNTQIQFDKQGRISTVTDEEGITYTMTATTETDNAAYDDAYNQYEYNQYVYDQRQNEINANIEILQAQDKSLELRLSSLDTQHSAIQTELEAVKKVMSKNIDNSFKTFSA